MSVLTLDIAFIKEQFEVFKGDVLLSFWSFLIKTHNFILFLLSIELCI